jgi:hypothetical protein
LVHRESVKCAPISVMFDFTPNYLLSNVWSLADLLSNNPDPMDLQETWNKAWHNLARAHERLQRFYEVSCSWCVITLKARILITFWLNLHLAIVGLSKLFSFLHLSWSVLVTLSITLSVVLIFLS